MLCTFEFPLIMIDVPFNHIHPKDSEQFV